MRQNPRPAREHIPSLYPEHYGSAVHDREENPSAKIEAPVHRYRGRAIERFKTARGSILDVGCGSGFFLEFMRRRGWDVGGVESAEEHVAYARDRLGLKSVAHTTWPAEKRLDLRADAVSMFHVIEHLPDPIGALSRAKEVLAEDGVLIVETPNVESWPMRLFGRYCTQFDAPRHFCLFSRATLKQCAQRAGFEVVETTTFSPTTMEYTESLRYLVQAVGLKRYRAEAAAEEPAPFAERLGGKRSEAAPPRLSEMMLDVVHAGERLSVRAVESLARMTNHGCNLFMVARK